MNSSDKESPPLSPLQTRWIDPSAMCRLRRSHCSVRLCTLICQSDVCICLCCVMGFYCVRRIVCLFSRGWTTRRVFNQTKDSRGSVAALSYAGPPSEQLCAICIRFPVFLTSESCIMAAQHRACVFTWTVSEWQRGAEQRWSVYTPGRTWKQHRSYALGHHLRQSGWLFTHQPYKPHTGKWATSSGGEVEKWLHLKCH